METHNLLIIIVIVALFIIISYVIHDYKNITSLVTSHVTNDSFILTNSMNERWSEDFTTRLKKHETKVNALLNKSDVHATLHIHVCAHTYLAYVYTHNNRAANK